MTLVELEAKFWSTDGLRRMGVSFRCPLCCTGYVTVPFANPVDGGPPVPGYGTLWRRGDNEATVETLTLTPSVDARGCCDAPCPGWHGFVVSGATQDA